MFASAFKLFFVCWNSTLTRGKRPTFQAYGASPSALNPYLIFYRVTDSEVIVQRMRHTARQPRSASGAP